jgi:hypothetical protein
MINGKRLLAAADGGSPEDSSEEGSDDEVSEFWFLTAGLTLDEVIDSNGMSQMSVFRSLGHPYISDNDLHQK